MPFILLSKVLRSIISRRGRPRITLISTLKQDLEKRNLCLNNSDDILTISKTLRPGYVEETILVAIDIVGH